ncbi:nitrilase and fragile histidine triad fusion protein NitFhit [Ixodes scapularis]|uniref:nitrilase and fragile histidine triad fusion protein NitFhit n=1 Tax=Ixodes scapularis TaxID=6945 RepID=UPI001A9FF511|nr:nitrilase and fragile histidine triad fusion protein NitFhit [Ixodes scapularis]
MVLAGVCQAYKHRGYGLCRRFAKSRWRRMFSTDVSSGSSCSTIAVCQLTSTSDKAANFQACSDLIHRAKSRGAQMVFLPEAMDFLAEKKAQAYELAEPLDGPLIAEYKSLAKRLSVWLSLGSVHIKDADQGNKVSNTHVVINSEGNIVDTYSKVHMFDVDVPGARIRESDYTAAGTRITRPVATPVGKVGLGICYDLRFPEFSLSLAKMGADIITYPSAFTVPTGMAHWEVIMRARAIESQCYVVSAAQVGQHNPKRSSYGHALVVDPWGCVVAQCSDAVGIAVAEINLDLVAKVRQAIPVWNHRRTDLYGNLSPCWSASEQGPPKQPQYQFGQVTVQAAHVFYKSPLTIAFVNKMPVLPGHVLVAPIRPALRLADLSAEEVQDLFLVVQRVQVAAEKQFGASSSTIAVQDGPDAGRSIDHIHVHVLPRRPGDFARNDEVYVKLQEDKKNLRPKRSDEEMAAEAEQLGAHF